MMARSALLVLLLASLLFITSDTVVEKNVELPTLASPVLKVTPCASMATSLPLIFLPALVVKSSAPATAAVSAKAMTNSTRRGNGMAGVSG